MSKRATWQRRGQAGLVTRITPQPEEQKMLLEAVGEVR
jgi:hypothetical protein